MRALSFLVVALAGLWLWRSLSSTSKKNDPDRSTPEIEPVAMVQCQRCGVHLPAAEAITGKQGSYCSRAHLQQSEI